MSGTGAQPMEADWPEADGSTLSPERWSELWERLGGKVPMASIRDQLLQHYSEPHRAYHTQQHLDECLSLFDRARSLCNQPDEVAIALWFHDAIYASRRNDNERQSAEWLLRIASDAGVAGERLPRLHALVMATCHDAVPSDRDAQVLVDIDLAILGSPSGRFDAYEHQIRREYRWVPNLIFRRKRAAVLRSFLDRPQIYSTKEFDQFEIVARENIRRSLTALSAWGE